MKLLPQYVADCVFANVFPQAVIVAGLLELPKLTGVD